VYLRFTYDSIATDYFTLSTQPLTKRDYQHKLLPKFGPSPPLELSISVFCLLFAIAVDLQALNRLRLGCLAKFAAAKEVGKVEEALEAIVVKVAEAIVVKAAEAIVVKAAVEAAVEVEEV
jgi:hypothetical protein